MDFNALNALQGIFNYHGRVLETWPEKHRQKQEYIDAVNRLDQYKLWAIREISTKENDVLHKALYELYYTFFTRTYSATPAEVVKVYIERAKKCDRVSSSGRYWPGMEHKDNEYGYKVTIKDPQGWKNLLLRDQYDENNIISVSELDKIEGSPMEKLALAIERYWVYVEKQKSCYYRTDY